MAEATLTTVTEERIETVEVPVVTLTLTVEEAQALRDLHHYAVAGLPGTRRDVIQGIAYALNDSGIRPSAKSDLDGVAIFQ